jgi:hypothetical protein
MLIATFIVLMTISCNGQPKSQYEFYTEPVVGAIEYRYFIEEDRGQVPSLQQDMDYLAPNVTDLIIAVSTAPSIIILLDNDNSRYILGVVAVDSQSYYSGMGVAVGQVGKVPLTPAGIGLRKVP